MRSAFFYCRCHIERRSGNKSNAISIFSRFLAFVHSASNRRADITHQVLTDQGGQQRLQPLWSFSITAVAMRKESIAMEVAAAKISSILPVAGPVGTAVTISGNGLDSGGARPAAFLNGALMMVTAVSPTAVTAVVPSVPAGTSSPIALQIGKNLVWSAQQFSVTG